jgi:pyruvate,water dikinase
VARFHTENWTQDPRFVGFERRVTELRAVEVRSLGWRELLDQPEQAFATLDRLIDLRIDYLPGVGASMIRLRLLLVVAGLSRARGDLLRGIRTRTDDANHALTALADEIRKHPSWLEVFAREPVERLAITVAEDPDFAELRDNFRDFDAEFGHRETTSALLASQPAWGEDPRIVLGAVQGLIGRPAGGAEPEPGRRPVEDTLLSRRRVRVLRLGPWIAAAAAATRSGIAFREDTHFHASRLLPVVRGALLEAGERLAGAGVLDQPSDVWHLRFDEIAAIDDPAQLTAEHRDRLRTVVADRAARREEYAGAPLISPASLHPRPAGGGALVMGSPASPGKATGPVRVIREASEFGLLQPGEVLVCPYTNPSWTPLFELAAAAVVDTGSVGSHAAITAREYGIPAVMGTGDGTSRLTDGQRVEVDGGTGQVRTDEAEER